MESQRPVRAAVAAVAVAAVAIAAVGNQWVVKRLSETEDGLGALLPLLVPFRWSVSDHPDSTAIKLAPYAAIAVTLVVLGLLVAAAARRAAGVGLAIAVVGATLVAALAGLFVGNVISYGFLYGSVGDPQRAGRLLWSWNNAAMMAGMWALVVGVLGGLLAAAVAGEPVPAGAAATYEPWGGQGQRGPNDTQAMWIPTQGGRPPGVDEPSWGTPAPTAAPPSTSGWSTDATVADLPRTQDNRPR